MEAPPGYAGIGIWHPRRGVNLGTLWRSAARLGASLTFSVQPRFPDEAWSSFVSADAALGQKSDTHDTWRHLPYLCLDDVAALRRAVPLAELVAVELCEGAVPLPEFVHPDRALYLLGAEDHGLTREVLAACDSRVFIPSSDALNVATAGAIVLYDRNSRPGRRPARPLGHSQEKRQS